jgi:hypothetical protein
MQTFSLVNFKVFVSAFVNLFSVEVSDSLLCHQKVAIHAEV